MKRVLVFIGICSLAALFLGSLNPQPPKNIQTKIWSSQDQRHVFRSYYELSSGRYEGWYYPGTTTATNLDNQRMIEVDCTNEIAKATGGNLGNRFITMRYPVASTLTYASWMTEFCNYRKRNH